MKIAVAYALIIWSGAPGPSWTATRFESRAECEAVVKEIITVTGSNRITHMNCVPLPPEPKK